MPRKVLAQTQVAGLKHYEGKSLLGSQDGVIRDTILIPRLEPLNQYDQYAVELYATAQDGSTVKMGYVPQAISQIIHVLLENNIPLQFTVVKTNERGMSPFCAVRIELKN